MNIPQWNGNFLKEFADQHIDQIKDVKKRLRASFKIS